MKHFLQKVWLFTAIVSFLMVAVLPGCAPATTPTASNPSSNAAPAAQNTSPAAEPTQAQAVPSGQKVTLQFWTRLADNTQIDKVVKDFNAANPDIEVIHQGIPGADYRTKLLASVAGGNPPDIVGMDVAIMPIYFGQKALLPLDDYLMKAGDSFVNDYGAGLFFSSRYEGKTYGVPWWSDPSIMIYNQTLMDQAGVSQVPETYDDLLSAAKAITKSSGDPATDVYGAIFPVISPSVMFTWLPYLWGAGGDFVDQNGCAGFNNAAGEEAMGLWVNLYNSGYMPRSAVFGQSSDELNKLFFSNRAGFMVSGLSLIDQAKKVNPDIKLGAAVMPRPANGKHSSYLGGDNLVIMKNTKYPDQAWKFIQYMVDAQRMNELAMTNNGIYIDGLPTRLSAMTDQYFTQFPYAKVAAEAQKVGRAPNTPYLTEARVPVYDAFQEALTGKKTIQQALADAEVKS